MKRIVICLLVLTTCALCLAQRGRGRRYSSDPNDPIIDRKGVPNWEVDKEFPEDVFTFVRIRYESGDNGGWRGYNKWATDYPDSDLNLPFRLQQLTSLRVNPNPLVLDFTDPRVFDYPFVYIIEPGDGMNLSPDEIEGFRRYCHNGGFVMVDDFWGEYEWEMFYRDLKRVFPEREPIDVPLEHPIFHCVYDLKEKPQVSAINWGRQGISYERPDAREVHYRGIFDDKDRLMVFICHNTDLGDGWEREGEDEYYFHEYSEKKAYPMGINIVFYAMTH
jgi:hypothetical protein